MGCETEPVDALDHEVVVGRPLVSQREDVICGELDSSGRERELVGDEQRLTGAGLLDLGGVYSRIWSLGEAPSCDEDSQSQH